MKMYTRSFNFKTELVDFVNENGIEKDQIISIFKENDGLFTIIYYDAD